tara:strand:- start:14104 stop:15000 length:897 start_codon:yes stop_codon:yes gene_type:complete
MKKIYVFIIVILLLWLVSFAISTIFLGEDFSDKIVIIPIKGVITGDGFDDFLSSSGAVSTTIVDFIKKADEDKSVKGIILEINSPGGTVVASKEIANEIKKTEKPVVAWIREIGTSGAYWVASSSDKIVADPLSITGSIGVIGSYLEFSGLMEEYGVGYERLISGEFKDAGSPYRKLTQKEQRLLQGKLDIIHDAFIDEVSDNRELSKSTVKELATGIFYLGKEAENLGLVDVLGGEDLAVNITKELVGVDDLKIVKYEEKKGLGDFLSRLSARSFYFIGRGVGKELFSLGNEFKIVT